MEINNLHYIIVDELEPLSVQDCFVKSSRKIGLGHGEGKFYVGGNNSDSILNSFWGGDFMKGDAERKCIVFKRDLEQYIRVMNSELEKPRLPYANPEKFISSYAYVRELLNQMPYFEFFYIRKTIVTHEGCYVNSIHKGTNNKKTRDAYEKMRHILVPIITSMQIYKLECVEEKETIYYWRPFPDFEAMANPERLLAISYSEKKRISKEEKDKIVSRFLKKSIVKDKLRRDGQTEFRQKLIDKFKVCPVTGIEDAQLLIASHIKPWAICMREKENNNIHNSDCGMYDPDNGILFSPLLDKLFDKGLITISNRGTIVFSKLLNPKDKEAILKTSIEENKRYFEEEIVRSRSLYLEYHRHNIFQGYFEEE